MIDYHTHTPLCKHAEGTRIEYLRAAEKANLHEIGVSDHSPWPEGYDPDWRMHSSEFPEYCGLIDEMRAITSDVNIKFAIEADWVSGKIEILKEKLESYPFDYIIGSIHYTDELPFDNPDKWHEIWTGPEKAEWIWHRYYELLLDMVSSGIFNIIGHFDLPKKFGSKCPDTDIIKSARKKIFNAARDLNIAVEINTAGLRKPANETYPALSILKEAAEQRILLTFGSDAHSPHEVAADFDLALTLAKEAGFKHYASFTQKKHTLHSLPI